MAFPPFFFKINGLVSGFRVLTSGFRVLGSGFWVQGSGFRVLGSLLRPPGYAGQAGFWVQGSILIKLIVPVKSALLISTKYLTG
jgi:hypothetical protein